MKAAVRRNRISFTARILFIACLAVLVTVFTAGIAMRASAKEDGERPSRKYYMSYEVQPGDTLWDLASEYNDYSRQDTESYIASVKRTNHLTDDTIHVGQNLALPYYE